MNAFKKSCSITNIDNFRCYLFFIFILKLYIEGKSVKVKPHLISFRKYWNSIDTTLPKLESLLDKIRWDLTKKSLKFY